LILTLNAGSSSLKFAVFDGETAALRGKIDTNKGRIAGSGRDAPWPHGIEADGLHRLLDWIDAADRHAAIDAVGHRVVHGGDRDGPVRIDPAVMAELEGLVELAPLHQPHNLAAIRAVTEARPDLPQVACFDTSFHRTMDAVASTLPLPKILRDAGARHYGFHGLSYQFIAGRLPPRAAHVVVAHLGSGASLCAMRDGRSVDTSMGMTALDGVMMGTRSGRLDPGAVLWMLQARGMDAAAIEDTLYHHAGLLGVSGESADMRDLAVSPTDAARLAVQMFVRSIVRETGALASVLGGVDAFVFTAGIGENQPVLRAQVAAGLSWLGLVLDPARNDAYRPETGPGEIGRGIWVIPTDEEAEIARLARPLVKA